MMKIILPIYGLVRSWLFPEEAKVSAYQAIPEEAVGEAAAQVYEIPKISISEEAMEEALAMAAAQVYEIPKISISEEAVGISREEAVGEALPQAYQIPEEVTTGFVSRGEAVGEALAYVTAAAAIPRAEVVAVAPIVPREYEAVATPEAIALLQRQMEIEPELKIHVPEAAVVAAVQARVAAELSYVEGIRATLGVGDLAQVTAFFQSDYIGLFDQSIGEKARRYIQALFDKHGFSQVLGYYPGPVAKREIGRAEGLI